MRNILIALIAGASLFGVATVADALFVPDYDFSPIYVAPAYIPLPACVPNWLGSIC
jgi:hypothetical protein